MNQSPNESAPLPAAARHAVPRVVDRPGGPRGRVCLGLLLIIVCIALPVRLLVCARMEMISRDGTVFIGYAKGLADDPLNEMRRQAQHPLYPAMILAAHETLSAVVRFGPETPGEQDRWYGDPVLVWQTAGMAVTLLGGLLAVAGIYALTARLFDRRTALMAAAMAALAAEFCQLSADVLSDMPHLGIHLFALVVAIDAIRATSGRYRRLLFAGTLSGLAFLIRPEGAEPAVAAALAVLFLAPRGSMSQPGGWSFRQRAAGVAALCIGAAVPALPYMVATGKLVQKKSLKQFLPAGSHEEAGLPAATSAVSQRTSPEGQRATSHKPQALTTAEASFAGDAGRALVIIAEKWLRSLRIMFVIPFVAWFLLKPMVRPERMALRLVQIVAGLHLCIVMALIIRFDYWDLFSMRHVLVLSALLLPFSAAGAMAIIDALSARVSSTSQPQAMPRSPTLAPSSGSHSGGRTKIAITVGLLALLVAPTLPWMLERRHADAAFLRGAGEWIRRQSALAGNGTPPAVLTTRHQVAFYAGGLQIWSPHDANADRILAEARDHKPAWLVFDERRMLRMSATFFGDLETATLPGEILERAHEEPQRLDGANRAIIYRYRPPQ